MNEPVVIERVATDRGELVLRRASEHYEVISNGTFLMDTRNGESERRLVTAALERSEAPATVLIGGLGVGFSLVEALADDRVARVVVVEIEPTLVHWHRDHLTHLTKQALNDERSEIVVADLRDYLGTTTERYDAICLDVDNGPEWTVTAQNSLLYNDSGTALLSSRLRPDGALSVWSATRAASYEALLRRHFESVDVHEIGVNRGEPDVVMVGRQVRGVRRRHGNRDSS